MKDIIMFVLVFAFTTISVKLLIAWLFSFAQDILYLLYALEQQAYEDALEDEEIDEDEDATHPEQSS